MAENISMLIHSFTNVDESILFFDCYLKTMVREWFGIDMHRLNKFMMVRYNLFIDLNCNKFNYDMMYIYTQTKKCKNIS